LANAGMTTSNILKLSVLSTYESATTMRNPELKIARVQLAVMLF